VNLFRKLNKDRTGACLLILLGTAVVMQGISYRMGDLTHMGPGFLPVVYGTLIGSVGVVLGLTARRGPDEKRLTPEWRGWACILAGVGSFVLLGHYGGLAPATFASVFISALGDRENTVREAALLAAAMVVTAGLIFTLGLHLQLPFFQWG
jgi:hypothetical protein